MRYSQGLLPSLVITLLLAFMTSELAAQQYDQRSGELVDRCVEAMGGMDNWNSTCCLKWTFFGRRDWHWNKATGDVRCEYTDGSMRSVMNINTGKGQVFAHGVVQTDQDSLEKFLDLTYKLWINDSYWLVMPFKMKDPGVTLQYIGQVEIQGGKQADVVEMTFVEVGVTPDNKYHVYFDANSGFVSQWDYYRSATDEEPRITNPWQDYKKYGSIMLSGDRGEGRTLDNLSTVESFDDQTFKSVDTSKPLSAAN